MTDATDGTISIVVGESHSRANVLPTKLQQQKVFTSDVRKGEVCRTSVLSNGPSRARIGVSHLSVPLAWNSDEHFGTRGEGKVYSMFVALQAINNANDSRVVTAIDRTCTDVAFTDSFIFENQPVDFEIEIQLYASRTDGGDSNQSLKQKLTRSFGRRFGTNYKTSWLSDDMMSFDPFMNGEVVSNGGSHSGSNSKYFYLLGRTTLTLSDAKPKAGIYDLHLLPNAANHGPPLYGHIRCRIVAQPNSVAMPLSDGILTIKPVGYDCLYQNMRCRLQAGVLRCVTNNSQQSQNQTILHIYINKDSKVLACKHHRSIVVTSDRYFSGSKRDKQFILTSDSEEDIAAWKHAIGLQIADCKQWGEFAVSSVKLTVEPDHPDVVILSRMNGRRLYDEIQIQVNGGMQGILKTDAWNPHRDLTIDTSKMVSFAPTTKPPIQTAPSGRRRNSRSHVRNLFQPVNDTECRYVINLPVRNIRSLQKTGSFSKLTTNDDYINDPSPCMQMTGGQYNNPNEQNTSDDATPENWSDNFFKGFKKSFQRSFGVLKNRRSVEVSRF